MLFRSRLAHLVGKVFSRSQLVARITVKKVRHLSECCACSFNNIRHGCWDVARDEVAEVSVGIARGLLVYKL